MTPRKAKAIAATVVRFARSAGEWETGIAVLPFAGTSDVTLIVDLDGQPVPTIYDYHLCQCQGCFTASDVDEFMRPADTDVAA